MANRKNHPGKTQEIDFIETVVGERVDALADEISRMRGTLYNGLLSKVDRIEVYVKIQGAMLAFIVVTSIGVSGYIIKLLLQMLLEVGG